MSGRDVATRSLGFAGAIATLIVLVPRAAELDDDALTLSVATASLLVTAALLCLLGRLWSGIIASLASAALILAFAGVSAHPDRPAVAVGAAALPLIAPLLAASVASKRWLAILALACGAVAGPLHALLYDPFFDPACRVRCAHSPLAVDYRPGWAAVAEHGGAWAAASVIVLMIPRARHRVGVVGAAVAAASLAFGVHPAALLAASATVVVVLARDAISTITLGMRLRELIAALGSSLDL